MKTLKLLCALTLLLPELLNAQVQCFFSSSALYGCPPLVVNFTDLTIGNPTTHFWDFGNGTTSTQPNPAYTFINPGTYNVKHRVSNGTSVDSCYAQIHVFLPPTANFTAPDARGCVQPCHTVHFQNQTTAGESSITEYVWNWGDGSQPVSLPPGVLDTSHCYNTPGAYAVTLVVKDSNTCQRNKTINTVKIGNHPSVTASANPIQSCTSPAVVNFMANGSTPNGGPVTYNWFFCNGSNSVQQNPSTVFFNDSCCSLLILKDTLGCADTASVCVQITQVQAGFDTALISNACASGIQFTDSSNYATSWNWNFGDGTTSTLQHPFHTYTFAGAYQVTLTATYNGCIDTETKQIAVTGNSSPPSAGFTYSVTGGCSGQIQFTDTTSWSTAWAWNFGDGTTSAQQSPVHTYAQPGNYTISLTVTSGSCSTTISKQVTYTGNTDFYVTSDFAPCPPFPVQFYNTGNAGLSYQWHFGDGETSTSHEPLHVYQFPGKYEVTLIVIDSAGTCTDTIKEHDFITVRGPIGNFSLTPDTGTMPLTVTITGTMLDTEHSVFDMGDGVAFMDSMPTQYTYTGGCFEFFPVATLTDSLGCMVSYPIDTITPRKAYGYFSLTPDTGSFPLTVALSSNYFDAVSIYWNMGDGTYYYDNIPQSHTYTTCGRYYPSAVLSDSSGCTTIYIVDTVVCSDLLSIETTGQATFKIYPNPANDVLVVELNDARQAELTLTNLLGEVVVKRKLKEATSSINVSELHSGLYVITVAGDDRDLRRQTFVKQ
jgi:PKD repeat protein